MTEPYQCTFNRSDGSTFTLTAHMPRSFAARYDLIGELGAHQGARLIRVLSAAIGLAYAGQYPPGDTTAQALPVYRNDGDITGYGGRVIEVLAGGWSVVPDERFWDQAKDLCAWMGSTLPTAEGVKSAESFT